jgi:hypothetical protein
VKQLVAYDPEKIRNSIENYQKDEALQMLFKAAYLLGATQAEMLGEQYGSDSKTQVYAQTGDDVKEDIIQVNDTNINVVVFTIRTERKKGKEQRKVLLPKDCELWAKQLYDYYKSKGKSCFSLQTARSVS